MREHKYKAWDRRRNQWIPQEHFGVTSTGQIIIAYDRGSIFLTPESEFGGYKESSEVTDVELSEYIGLKDKNGKEIYEGDIFRDELGRLFEVYWHTKTASFWVRLISTEDNHLYRIGTNFAVELESEIIGNIYENPKLPEDNQ